jgi:hypothetical protein
VPPDGGRVERRRPQPGWFLPIERRLLRAHCLGRRGAERERPVCEIADGERQRNAGACTKWMFATDRARTKLPRLPRGAAVLALKSALAGMVRRVSTRRTTPIRKYLERERNRCESRLASIASRAASVLVDWTALEMGSVDYVAASPDWH